MVDFKPGDMARFKILNSTLNGALCRVDKIIAGMYENDRIWIYYGDNFEKYGHIGPEKLELERGPW